MSIMNVSVANFHGNSVTVLPLRARETLPFSQKCFKKGISTSCLATTQESSVNDHVSFIRDVAGVEPPTFLHSLVKVLEAKGETIVPPANREGILPLAIPLTKNLSSGELTALLRWPTSPEGMEMPVVAVRGNGVVLQSKTIESYIRRALAEEDSRNDGFGPLAEAAGEQGRSLYQEGEFKKSGIEKLNVFLTRKVALFPDVLESLALSHLENGDEISALVAGEFYGRNHFPGFGRPFVFNAELLKKVGRDGESRDSARSALKSPWWTLGSSYQEVAALAVWGDTQLEYVKERLTEEGKQEDLTKGKAPAQVALDQAAFLLDVCCAEGSWDSNKARLAALYHEGGYPQLAAFILS